MGQGWGTEGEGEWKDSAETLSRISDPLTWRALGTCEDQAQWMAGPGDQKRGLVRSRPALGGVGHVESVFTMCVQDSHSDLRGLGLPGAPPGVSHRAGVPLGRRGGAARGAGPLTGPDLRAQGSLCARPAPFSWWFAMLVLDGSLQSFRSCSALNWVAPFPQAPACVRVPAWPCLTPACFKISEPPSRTVEERQTLNGESQCHSFRR